MSAYTTVDAVIFIKTLPSGKSFVVNYQDQEYVVPNFALSEESPIWDGSKRGEVGNLILQEHIALEKGLIKADRNTGIGIPLKRNKMPDKPELMSDDYLGRIKVAMDSADRWMLADDSMPMLAYPVDTPIALFEGPNAEANVVFAANAPATIRDLLDENAKLRTWMEEATKKFTARRKRK